MKHFWLFMLTLILFAAMALGSVSLGVTADKEGEIERVADLNTENTPSASRYSVSGSRFGLVTVKDATTGEVIRTFQMDTGVVVRETFLLDGGKTVAASQKDHAVFWDLATGREIHRFPQRIYGFSHDETKFFTYELPHWTLWLYGKHDIVLYSYPDMNLVCKLLPFQGVGPEKFLFSPNDRFLAVNSYTGVALSDEDYLNPPMQIRGLRLTNLFDLEKCETIEEFSKLGNPGLGEFSPDSSFYVVQDALVLNGRRILGYCQFNLRNYQLENCTNTSPPPQQKQEPFVPLIIP
ncbi:MAG TPA: hypothetical protein VK211_09695 [Kamptonema sp.]|nr:hypothetical protein [Kamptonema sp.]